jgi:lysine-specific demethylase 8
VGYLAQHRLFDQVPALASDYIIPDYCVLRSTAEQERLRNEHFKRKHCCESTADIFEDNESEEDDHEVVVQMWLGPPHTISPLHHDAYNNFLCQVHGKSNIAAAKHTHYSIMLFI